MKNATYCSFSFIIYSKEPNQLATQISAIFENAESELIKGVKYDPWENYTGSLITGWCFIFFVKYLDIFIYYSR